MALNRYGTRIDEELAWGSSSFEEQLPPLVLSEVAGAVLQASIGLQQRTTQPLGQTADRPGRPTPWRSRRRRQREPGRISRDQSRLVPGPGRAGHGGQ